MSRAAVLGGRYRLDALLAEGGMGEVWRARDELLERDVAVKLLRSSLASDPVVAERFRREARAAASLSHPNMANVFDFVEEDGRPGIVMELVGGDTLAEVIARDAPMPAERAVRLLDQVLDALGAAHAAGVVHRDVKPGNVILDANGKARVTDFGIARAVGDSTLTETGTVLGSVHYVAPEQLEGSPVVAATDLYAAGVMLYEMLTGTRPFDGESAIATAMSRLTNEPVPPTTHQRHLAPAIEAVIMRALRRDPAARFASAAEMRAALDAAVGGGPDPTLVMPVADDAATRRIPRQAPVPRRRRGERPPPGGGIAAPGRLRKLAPLWIALFIALLLLTLIGFVATRPTTAKTPNLVGLTLEKAIERAESFGLKLDTATDVTRSFSSRPKNEVLSVTKPKIGEVVPRGTHVKVVVSDGPKPCCTVPSLTGQTEDEARRLIEASGLRVGSVGHQFSDAPEGTVIDQTPAAGRTLERGDEVDIVVSAGEERRRGKGKGDD